LLAAAGDDPALADRLVRASIARARVHLAEPLRAEVRANVALHAVYLLMQVDDARLESERTFFLDQLDRAARHPDLEGDVLTRANILEALARSDRVEPVRLRPMAESLVAGQEPDGGWHSRVGEQGSALRVFTTLRVVLALKRYGDLVADEPELGG
jgi:hypothetical protein